MAVNSGANDLKRTPVPAITAVLQLHHPLLQQNIFHISKKCLCVGFAFVLVLISLLRVYRLMHVA